METLDPEMLLRVTGGWGFSAQGQTPLPFGGNAQGGFTIGTEGVGAGAQGQMPLPGGGVAKGGVQAGDYSMPSLP